MRWPTAGRKTPMVAIEFGWHPHLRSPRLHFFADGANKIHHTRAVKVLPTEIHLSLYFTFYLTIIDHRITPNAKPRCSSPGAIINCVSPLEPSLVSYLTVTCDDERLC